MQQTLRAKLASDPDITADLDVEYEDDEWMEEARRGISLAAKMVAEMVPADLEETA
jgi:hypothetical protein